MLNAAHFVCPYQIVVDENMTWSVSDLTGLVLPAMVEAATSSDGLQLNVLLLCKATDNIVLERKL